MALLTFSQPRENIPPVIYSILALTVLLLFTNSVIFYLGASPGGARTVPGNSDKTFCNMNGCVAPLLIGY